MVIIIIVLPVQIGKKEEEEEEKKRDTNHLDLVGGTIIKTFDKGVCFSIVLSSSCVAANIMTTGGLHSR